jgi:hypothetical protein
MILNHNLYFPGAWKTAPALLVLPAILCGSIATDSWLLGAVSETKLELRVQDGQGNRLPCRLLVRQVGGASFVPEDATELAIGPDRWFFSPGQTRLSLPTGPVEVRAEHGPEYPVFKDRFDLTEAATTKTIRLDRWIHMRELGYASGENHLHVEASRLAPMLAAEDLDFGTSMTWWNGPDNSWCLPVPPGEGKSRTLIFADKATPTSVYDGEIEYAWGAAYFLNLPGPMPIRSDARRPNLDFLRHVVQSGGFVHYQGGWSREVAVDALLGLVHAVNVCNNNFHRHRFQPRSQYSNLLEVAGFPIYPDTDEGMMRMNTDTYYRLLNWGLNLAAGAGSATGFKEVPVGYNRAYVQVGPDASLDDFYRAWADGKNFVTNGPMLFLEAGEGSTPGDTLPLPEEGGSVKVRVKALSLQPLTSLELVVNGEVASRFKLTDPHEIVAETRVMIRTGTWMAARCTARDELLNESELAAYANGERQQPSRLRFAHTSPIYVPVGGRSAAVRKSILEGMKMLAHFEDFSRQNAAAEHLASILSATEQARKVLDGRLHEAMH